jgi:hypothetical protein
MIKKKDRWSCLVAVVGGKRMVPCTVSIQEHDTSVSVERQSIWSFSDWILDLQWLYEHEDSVSQGTISVIVYSCVLVKDT